MTKARLSDLQPGDVGDGAERDEVEQVDDLRLGPVADEPAAAAQLAQQRDAEQEGHADRGEMAVGRAELALVEPVGVDHRERDRKQARALVMVDDDHVEPGGLGLLERLERLRAAIDGDRQARAALLQLDQRLARRAVALHQPVGDVDHRLGAEAAQQQHQQRRAGRAVDVIIAEDGDGLACLDRVGEPLGALVHVLEAGRVGEEIADRRLAVAGEVVALDPAGEQQLVDQRVGRQPGLARPPPAPRLAADRPLDIRARRSCAPRLAAVAQVRARFRAAMRGSTCAEKPLPPATPKPRPAMPNQRLTKLSVRSMLWILRERQDHGPPPPPAACGPAAGRRRARSSVRRQPRQRTTSRPRAGDRRRERRIGAWSAARAASSEQRRQADRQDPDDRPRDPLPADRPGQRPPAERVEDRRRPPRRGRAARATWSPLPPSSLARLCSLSSRQPKRVAHGPGADDRRLRALGGQGDVGAGQQPAAAAEADLGAVEPEAVVAQQRCGRCRSRARSAPAAPRRRTPATTRWARMKSRDRVAGAEQAQPERAAERVEAEHVAERLGQRRTGRRTAPARN